MIPNPKRPIYGTPTRDHICLQNYGRPQCCGARSCNVPPPPSEGWRPPPLGGCNRRLPPIQDVRPVYGTQAPALWSLLLLWCQFPERPRGFPPRSVTPTGVPWTLGGWVPLKKKPGPAPPGGLEGPPGGLQPAAGLGHHPSRGHALPPLVTPSAATATSDPDGDHPPSPSHSRRPHRTRPTLTPAALRPSCPSHVFAPHSRPSLRYITSGLGGGHGPIIGF